MLWTDQEVNEAKSKPASEVPWLDEGPYLSLAHIADERILRDLLAAPCRQRD